MSALIHLIHLLRKASFKNRLKKIYELKSTLQQAARNALDSAVQKGQIARNQSLNRPHPAAVRAEYLKIIINSPAKCRQPPHLHPSDIGLTNLPFV